MKGMSMGGGPSAPAAPSVKRRAKTPGMMMDAGRMPDMPESAKKGMTEEECRKIRDSGTM